MRGLRLTPLPGALLGLTAILLVAMTLLSVGEEPAYDTITYGLAALSFAIAGALVASRHPRHPVGWIFCALGVQLAVGEVAQGYALSYAGTGRAGVEPAEWLAAWNWAVGGGLFIFVFLLFPDGRLPGRRWRPLPWIGVIGTLLTVVGFAFGHTADSEFASGTNPYASDALPFDAIAGIGMGVFAGAFLAAIASFALRFRRTRGVERQQLKWFAYGVVLALVVMPVTPFLYYDSVAVQVSIALVIGLLPVTACIGILRYRLYDVDVVINRTLVYGTLTLLLGSAYALTTLVLGTALSTDSTWATAGATLAAAAAFRPLRSRVQDLVDRRFSRARYDARHRVAEFLEALRAGREDPEAVEPMLRSVLEDPRLELRYLLPESDVYVDAAGRPASAEAPAGLERTPIERAGMPIGAVLHRPPDPDRPDLLAEVVGAAGLAIEITRLRVELRRQLGEIDDSRARIVSAGNAERRRLERDLHDGAQQRLVSIGLALRHAQHELGPDLNGRANVLDEAVDQLALAIEELRELARGVRPALLDDGLGPALRELAARAPLPVQVHVDSGRYPDDIEAAAYFIACEGLTNAVRHAQATTVALRAEARDGRLVMSVRDNGRGGASAGDGTGLRGLADRAHAHGGSLTVESRTGEGTTLVAELPCGS